MNKEIVKPFLSKSIEICERCGKIDIKTYVRYKLKNGKMYQMVLIQDAKIVRKQKNLQKMN